MRVRFGALRLFALLASVALGTGTVLAVAVPAAQAAGPVNPSKDPFYIYTGTTPLAQIAPGKILKRRSISLTISGVSVPLSSEQLLYRTTGEMGQPTITVTTVIRPLLSLGGTQIVAYQSAYDALGAQCDPSYTLRGGNPGDSTAQAEDLNIAAYLAAGYVVTVSDYEGEKLDFGAGQEAGYGTLDAIRATESYLKLSSSTKVGMVGYSGGAIATEWASELAPAYAPGLHIVGAAAGGVPVDLAHNLTYINGSQSWGGVIPALLDSLGRSSGVSFSPYLSAYGLQVTSAVKSKCVASISYPGLTIQQLLLPQDSDPFQIPALVTILNHLIMGTSGGTPAEPLLFGVGNSDGTGDGVMIAGDVEALAHHYCQSGVAVTFDEYSGLGHEAAGAPFAAHAISWLGDRFSGSAAPNGCASIGPGNSLAPLPPPTS